MRLRTEHYRNYIEEQDACRLTMHILRLKKEKTRFMRKIEASHYGKPRPLLEKDAQKIERYRWYIEDTLSALEKIGKPYTLDAGEKAAFQFQKNIPFISHVNFFISGYLGGVEKYEIRIEQEQAYLTYSLSDTTSVPPIIQIEPDHLPKEDFLDFIHTLHMGEWLEEYTAHRENFMLFHHVMWGVEVYYTNTSAKSEFGGLNAFPYNFGRILHFFESYKKIGDRI